MIPYKPSIINLRNRAVYQFRDILVVNNYPIKILSCRGGVGEHVHITNNIKGEFVRINNKLLLIDRIPNYYA